MIHARIQEFSSDGGRGGVLFHLAYKKALTTFYLFIPLVLNSFYRSPVVTFKETIICQGSSGGGPFSRGVQLFTGGGGPIAFSL